MPPQPSTKPQSPDLPSSTRKLPTSHNPSQKYGDFNIRLQLKYLLDTVSLSDIIFQKSLLDFHYIVVVNWKVFEYEVMKKLKLWGNCRAYSSFNKDILQQGYQKIKFQGSKNSRKVRRYSMLCTSVSKFSFRYQRSITFVIVFKFLYSFRCLFI